MGIYTRSGDDGETGLFGGDRVSKSSVRISAYGDVDELNSLLGWCAAAAAADDVVRLHHVQALLFSLGSWLATPPQATSAAREMLPAWPGTACSELETQIDAWERQAGELKNFILPGGSEFAARLHVCRAVCRRAERSVVELSDTAGSDVDPQHVVFLNRLSDWLFAYARAATHQAGGTDVPWVAPS